MNKAKFGAKKFLSLLLCLLMVLGTGVFAFADDCEHDYVVTKTTSATCTADGVQVEVCSKCGDLKTTVIEKALDHLYNDGVHVDATCTTPGGILYTCVRPGCSDAEELHTRFDPIESEPALDHDLGDWYYAANPLDAAVFARCADCSRCDYVEYERGEDGSINTYYKIDFYTNYHLDDDGFYTASDGTTLGDPNKYTTAKVGELYVISGGSIDFSDTPRYTAYRAPTAECGRYTVSGWTVDLENVQGNANAYAIYEEHDIYHKVKFNLPDGSSVTTPNDGQTVLHGHAAIMLDPTKKSDLTYNYIFAGWDIDFSHVYSDLTVTALFNNVKRTYKAVYFDKDGNIVGGELFNNGGALVNAPDFEDYFDNSYSYRFTGKWTTSNGASVNISDVNVPSWLATEYDAEKEGDSSVPSIEKGILELYPVFEKAEKLYPLTVNLASNRGDILNGAVVRILNSKGFLSSSATVNNKTSLNFNLKKDNYVVEVTYDGETKTLPVAVGEEGEAVAGFTFVIREYEPVEDPCNHICHVAIFGRIYIMFLNINYLLTGKKSVCCDDMYSGRYASALKYGP